MTGSVGSNLWRTPLVMRRLSTGDERHRHSGSIAACAIVVCRGPADETYLPAESTQTKTLARVSEQNANSWGAHRSEKAKSEGAPPTHRVRVVNRLRSSEQFRLAYREGRRASNDFFTVHARRNGLSQSRVGIAVSGRIGKAVVRNRVRRRIREVFRSLPDIPAGVDVVVVAKGAVKEAAVPDLIEGARDLVRRTAGDG